MEHKRQRVVVTQEPETKNNLATVTSTEIPNAFATAFSSVATIEPSKTGSTEMSNSIPTHPTKVASSTAFTTYLEPSTAKLVISTTTFEPSKKQTYFSFIATSAVVAGGSQGFSDLVGTTKENEGAATTKTPATTQTGVNASYNLVVEVEI
ncbi:hypothetical protein HELRODRAFT_180814 [Helobdella robusta]|uniref:Uncharacterized protein n=1 Tax=Helobdella robusta TaxID=6412 RepID=T1FGB3_HELRO|nr:hypothetical protein HELRODRAFT_180814 [Helobdella robusta]ESN93497.1 hypothetical protein HELRODRAFT_180814 [Helobdella robusta]